MVLSRPIETTRLRLRTLADDDATPAYLEWLCDPEVNRYLEARLVEHSLKSLARFIEECNASASDLLLGICLRAAGRHIGNIKLGPISVYHRHAAVGVLIGDRTCWGRGYATEAIQAVTRHAFEGLGLEKLYAGCYADNVGSQRAFLNAGFVEEARQKAFWQSDNVRQDNLLLGLTRPHWEAGRRG